MKKKIIIAESIRRAVDIRNTLFARGGVAVFAAGTCEDILHLHHTEKADLIIADLALPVMGGIKLCSFIRREPSLKDVSIILACDSEPAMNEARPAGANAVLAMPLDAAELFSTVSRMLMVHQRLSVRTPLRMTVEGRDGKAEFIGISRDLSVSGMLLESGRMLQTGDQLECSFTLNSRVVSVKGVVSRGHRSKEGGFLYGIKFLHLDAKTFVLIEHFIKSNGTQGSSE